MTEHTPGPWTATPALGGEWHVNSDDDQMFARVLGAPVSAEADARLIAAAPAMLEALETAGRYLEQAQAMFDRGEAPTSGFYAWKGADALSLVAQARGTTEVSANG